MKYKNPDLIQRIYNRFENGDRSKYDAVLNDLRTGKREFEMEFDFYGRKILWTCFEASRYSDVIIEENNCLYFYLADSLRDLEVVILSHTYTDELKKPILERTPSFHYVWVLSQFFPGLQSINERPIKILLQPLHRDQGPVSKLNYWFKKMLLQYNARTKPIFEVIDVPGHGKRWKKIVERSQKG